MRLILRFCAALLTMLLAASCALADVEHSGAYDTYNYSYADNGELLSAAAYVPVRVIRAEDMGLSQFRTLSDLYVDEETGNIWLVDTDNNRVVRTDLTFSQAEEFTLGRPHVAIDPALRMERFRQEARETETAVILMDFLLGYALCPDPAGMMAPLIREEK